MGVDPLSPIAPARVRTLLLPVGRITRARFLEQVERVEPQGVVRLGDVSADARPNRNMFSPLAFPTGLILYHHATAPPPGSQSSLFPFELFREPLMVLGIVDAHELGRHGRANGVASMPQRSKEEGDADWDGLQDALEDLRDQYPKALVHQLLLFDHLPGTSPDRVPKGIFPIPPPEQCQTTTMKTLMCDLTSLLLAEMTTFAKSLQGLPSIESPSTSDGSHLSNGYSAPSDAWTRSTTSGTTQSSRSGSPATIADKVHYRMSMPTPLPSAGSEMAGAGPGTRSRSPPSRPGTPPPTVGDHHGGYGDSPGKAPRPSAVTRSSAGGEIRDPSRDRIAVHGFGSGSLSERARNRGKSRVGVVIGALYLQAGRWPDAVRELVEGAAIAKANSDHLWHAKALENIMVGLVMSAWAGMDFQIPQICYPVADKAPDRSSDSHAPRSSAAPNRLISLQNLTALLPDLLNNILNLYARASNFSGESLPPLAFAESVVRFSKLLTAAHLAGGQLDEDGLQHLVLNASSQPLPRLGVPRTAVTPTRTEIASMLFRAFPGPSAAPSQSVTDRVLILAGMTAVLSRLGLHRKKAFVMRELISVLTPGLVQARKLGAAAMGVHPAAGLAALKASGGRGGALDLGVGDVEAGLDHVLGILGSVYGVVSVDGARRPTAEGTPDDAPAPSTVADDTDEVIIARINHDAARRSFGSPTMKLIILRQCINLCEALPDFHGVLRFTTELLRTAGSGVAPRVDSDEGSTNLAREEQVRLATNISRTVNAAAKLGVRQITAEYWDEFLARGVDVIDPPTWKMPIAHAKSELASVEALQEQKEKSPFIYNPFLKRPDAAVATKILVAGEYAELKITMQNPFEFEMEIERIRLESRGVAFDSIEHNTVIGAYRTKMLSMFGIPKTAGALTITGCIVKIRGCRERRFPIFTQPWSPAREVKMKRLGLAASEASISASSTTSGPRPSALDLTVIGTQPIVVVQSVGLPQSAVMLLEGEVHHFTITLQNVSRTTPVDLLLFAFQDSTTGPLQAAMKQKDLLPSELYELELLCLRREALRWRRTDATEPFIEPGASATFDMEILGKPGLTDGMVQLDYAHLGVPREEVTGSFYTRQLTIPITVTVNASVEMVRADLVATPDDDQRCLLLLDLRNSWPSSLTVTLQLCDVESPPESSSSDDAWTDASTFTETVQAGHTARMMIPLPRIFLPNAHAPIPILNRANQRQFIYGASKLSPEAERLSREAFWYGEAIRTHLRARWVEDSSSRRGEIQLRDLRLSARMVEAFKIPDVEIDMSIEGLADDDDDDDDDDEHAVRTVARSTTAVPTERFLSLTTRIRNRSSKPIYPMLRLQPSLRHQPHNVALDVSKRLLWNGVLQQALPLLAPGDVVEASLGICVLCRGEYEIGAQVEEVRVWQDDGPVEPKKTAVMDRPLGDEGVRRVWYARSHCLINAYDEHDRDESEGEGEGEDEGGREGEESSE